MANVKISRELFMELLRFHLAGDESGRQMIEKELEKKVRALAQHENYTRSLTAASEEERQMYKERYQRNKT